MKLAKNKLDNTKFEHKPVKCKQQEIPIDFRFKILDMARSEFHRRTGVDHMLIASVTLVPHEML